MMQLPDFDSKSAAYKQGYLAYKSWLYNGNTRPENPYDQQLSDQYIDYLNWYQGWEDASFES